jgi:hypothetical protein
MCIRCRARSLGRDARILRKGVGECPFPFGDVLAFSWVAGWNEEDREVLQAVRALESEGRRNSGQGRVFRR